MVLMLAPLALAACSPNRVSQGSLGCATATTPCLSGPATVALQTSRGEVRIELDGEAAPLTAGNFVDLVKRGVYDGTVFHRVVRDPTPFVVQGGDPASANPVVPPSQYGSGSYVDPASGEARLIPLEVKLKDEASPRYGQPLTDPGVSRELSLVHQRGAVAMARSADPNSASAQFYVALEALPELDGRYAVFGRVSEGMEVIDTIRQGDKITKASLVSGGKLVRGGD
ncbi:peptidylprolyl isomerase [Cyanobium sp. NIES-981]|uniref:peptidylprolyl isomerase n=1 Tax=Cyanobium sp. NIES-981 TaxID=1851505 RepID=UPI000B34B12E|nr:peptidylprolyl isomerase [Cyanobium sp. NIES-981]